MSRLDWWRFGGRQGRPAFLLEACWWAVSLAIAGAAEVSVFAPTHMFKFIPNRGVQLSLVLMVSSLSGFCGGVLGRRIVVRKSVVSR